MYIFNIAGFVVVVLPKLDTGACDGGTAGQYHHLGSASASRGPIPRTCAGDLYVTSALTADVGKHWPVADLKEVAVAPVGDRVHGNIYALRC